VPTRYGPRAAPPGPLPSGWSAAAAAPGAAASGGSTAAGPNPTGATSPSANAPDDRAGTGEAADALGGLVLAAALVAGVGTFYLLGRRRGRTDVPAAVDAGAEVGGEPLETSATPAEAVSPAEASPPAARDDWDDIEPDGGPEARR
jgi:hypothetical protein